MYLDILWANAYGGMSVMLLFLISLIYPLRKIGNRAFNVLNVIFLLNLAIYQITVLFEINSFYYQYEFKNSILYIRFLSIFIVGPVFYLAVIEKLSSFESLKSFQGMKVLGYSIALIILFITFELRSATPFAFLIDNQAERIDLSIIIKRVILLSYTLFFTFYVNLTYIRPSLKDEHSPFKREIINVFKSRYKCLLFTFFPSLIICLSPLSVYWIKIQMLLIATMTYMQFLSNASRYSKSLYLELDSSIESFQKKDKIVVENGDLVLEKLMKAIEKEKLYLDSNLSLNSLSSHIKYPAHVVSIVINKTCKMSFIQLINSYRVDDAKDLLLKNDESLSISTIALDVGFNSVSTFNRAFKKAEGVTPSYFQKINKMPNFTVKYS